MNTVAYLNGTDERIHEEKLEKVFGKCLLFDSLEDLLTTKTKVSAIAVNCSETDELLTYIKKIRQSNKAYLVPIILVNEKHDNLFADGYFSNLNEALDNCNKINNLVQQLKGRKAGTWKSKFLSYLFTRPELVIAPIADWKSKSYYKYPLLELFSKKAENYLFWLDDLQSSAYLNIESLTDQPFCCPFCFSAHIKFTDHCPSCNSISIRKESFLHCFTCGIVAPQAEFMKNDRFVCPRCNSKLKHIGDDYDRPLENGVCNDCNSYHTDTGLAVSCMICDKKYSADSLTKRAFYTYKLTDTGKNYIRYDTIDINSAFADNMSYVNQHFFYYTLGWLISMQKRYAEDFFSIIGFNFYNLIGDFGIERLHDFAKQLRALLRTTDFCTRLNENVFWIILTKTDHQGAETVKDRITKIYSELTKNAADEELKIVQFTSSQENTKEENAKVLIAKLGADL